MSKLWQLSALMRKNLILMKRSCCATICEILFPIILMLLLVMVRKAFKVVDYPLSSVSDADYITTNSTALITTEEIAANPLTATWNGLTIRDPL
jgi:hypothetical protein